MAGPEDMAAFGPYGADEIMQATMPPQQPGADPFAVAHTLATNPEALIPHLAQAGPPPAPGQSFPDWLHSTLFGGQAQAAGAGPAAPPAPPASSAPPSGPPLTPGERAVANEPHAPGAPGPAPAQVGLGMPPPVPPPFLQPGTPLQRALDALRGMKGPGTDEFGNPLPGTPEASASGGSPLSVSPPAAAAAPAGGFRGNQGMRDVPLAAPVGPPLDLSPPNPGPIAPATPTQTADEKVKLLANALTGVKALSPPQSQLPFHPAPAPQHGSVAPVNVANIVNAMLASRAAGGNAQLRLAQALGRG